PVDILTTHSDVDHRLLDSEDPALHQRLHYIDKAPNLFVPKLLTVRIGYIQPYPGPLRGNPCPCEREYGVEVDSEDINAAFLIEYQPIFLKLVVHTTHVRESQLTNIAMTHRGFGGHQRYAVETFFEAVGVL